MNAPLTLIQDFPHTVYVMVVKQNQFKAGAGIKADKILI